MNGNEVITVGVPGLSVLHIPKPDNRLEGRYFESNDNWMIFLEIYHCLKREQNFSYQDYRRATHLTKMFLSVTTESRILT